MRLIICLASLWLLLFSQAILAENIEVTTAKIQLKDGIYQLDARINYSLHHELTDALHSGISLPLKVIIRVYVPYDYWLNENVAFLKQRYELSYHALSRQYIVLNHNSNVRNSFNSLTNALNYLGKIDALPIMDQQLLNSDKNYRVQLRAAINTGQLSIPLRLSSYFYGPWHSKSPWWDMPL